MISAVRFCANILVLAATSLRARIGSLTADWRGSGSSASKVVEANPDSLCALYDNDVFVVGGFGRAGVVMLGETFAEEELCRYVSIARLMSILGVLWWVTDTVW